jgi:tetratricopeptide (TPR) repeat protein
LGNIAYQQAAYAEAEIRFQTAIDIAPDAPAAHYNLAWAKLRQGKTADARLAAQMAETLSPDHPRFGNAVAAIEAEAAKMQAH